MNFSGGFVLPVPPRLYRPVEFNSPGPGTIINAAATIPAFLRMQYYRRLALLRMRYIYVYLADLHAVIAPVADIRIENHRTVRCHNIRHSHYFFFCHFILQLSVRSQGFIEYVISPDKLRCNLYYGLHNAASYCPSSPAVTHRS